MIKRLSISGLLALTLSGCGLTGGQQQAVNRFAVASTAVGEFSAQELTHMREATIDMNTRRVALTGKAMKDLDDSFDVQPISERVAAATVLAEYGRLLLALVNDNSQEAELHDASVAFVDSFRDMQFNGKKMSDNQLEALGSMVMQIGGLWVEREKAEAVKKIVNMAKNDVDAICDLLTADFNQSSMRLAQDLKLTIDRLKTNAVIALNKAGEDAEIRQQAADALRLANDEEKRLTVLGEQASETLSALKTANAELEQAVTQGMVDTVDIKNLSLTIKELADATRTISGK